MYAVHYSNRAESEVRKLPRGAQLRILRKVEGLKDNPRPYGVRKIEGSDDLYRIRDGDYRIIYAIDDRRGSVMVWGVAHRGEAY